jgi:hypothetical protein
MPPSIFISYSHEDSSLVGPIVALLRASEALVIQDADSIRPGKRWREEIGTAISGASVVVVFWCYHARASQEVENEITAAIAQRKDILPLLLDETPLPSDLAGFQYIDFRAAFGKGHGIAQDRDVLKPPRAWQAIWWIAIALSPFTPLAATAWIPTSYPAVLFQQCLIALLVPVLLVQVVGLVLYAVWLWRRWVRQRQVAHDRAPGGYQVLAQTIEAELVRRTGASAT